MMQRKLDWLSPISDPPDKNGIVYVNMKFDDGTLAYKGAKPADMVNHYADLLAISMSPELVEIELEDTGKKTQKGATKYKLVGYPGWSAPVAQGGKAQANANGKSYGNSWYNSEEGVRFTQERTNRRTALMQSVEFAGARDLPWGEFADDMYEWLMRGEGQQDAEVRASGDEAAKPITERTTDPIPASTSVAVTGKDSADEPKGEPASTGGSMRAGSPEGNPWEGMGVE